MKLKNKIQSGLKNLGLCVLSVAVGFVAPCGVWAAAPNRQKLSQPLASDADAQRRFVVDTQVEDLMFLTHQVHQITKKSNKNNEAEDIQEYALSRANVLNPPVSVPTDLSRLEILYSQPSEGKKNGRIEVVLQTSKFESRHIINGFDEFTSPPARYSIGNLLRFATTKGLYVIPLRWFRESLFRAPIPVLHLLPLPPIKGAKITDIQVQHLVTDELIEMARREEAYQSLIDKPLLMDDHSNPKDYICSGDVVMRIETDHGVVNKVFDHTDETLEVAKRLSLLYWWASLYVPDIDNHQAMQNLQDMYAKELYALLHDHALKRPTDKHQIKRHNLIMSALAQISRTKAGLQALLKAVPYKEQGELTSFLHQVATQDRQTFNIQEQTKAWLEKVQNAEHQNKMKLKTLAYSKLMIQKSLTKLKPQNLRSMSRSTKVIVGLTGSAVAAHLGGKVLEPELFSYVMHYGLKQMQEFGQKGFEFLSKEPWIIGPMLQEGTDLWYVAAGTVAAASLLGLSVLANSFALRSNHVRSWTPFRKFYKTTLRVMATLNYPLQAVTWEKIFRQRVLYGALDHGLKLNDMPWSSTNHRLALPWPGFLHSPFASKRQIQYTARKVNRALEKKSLNSRRVGFLAGLALVSKEYSIDPASLLMEGAQKSDKTFDGDVSSSDWVLSTKNDEDWAVLNEHVVRLYQWLRREYSDHIDAEMVQKSYRYYEQIAQNLERNKKLSHRLWKWAKLSAVPYLAFGTSARNLSNRLKNSDPNQRTTDMARKAAVMDYHISFFLLLPLPFMKMMETELAGRLLAAPVLGSKVWQNITPEQVAQSVQPMTLGAHQVVLSANGYIGFEKEAVLEDLKEQHHCPLTHAYFKQEGASLTRQRVMKNISREMSEEVFQLAGVPYNKNELLLKEKSRTFLQDLSLMGKDIKQGAFPRAFEKHWDMIQHLAGDAAQGSLAVEGLVFALSTVVGSALVATVSTADVDFLVKSLHGALMGMAGAVQVFFIKHSFIGYTQVWPYVYYFSDVLKQNASQKAEQFEKSLFLISTGIRISDRGLVVKGVKQLLEQYQSADVQPEIDDLQGGVLNLDSNRAHHYTNQQAALLYKHALASPPFATRPNALLRDWMIYGGVGVFGSTVLAFTWVYQIVLGDLPEILHTQGVEAAWKYLGESVLLSLGALGGTMGVLYVGKQKNWYVKMRNYIDRQIERVKKYKSSCHDLLH